VVLVGKNQDPLMRSMVKGMALAFRQALAFAPAPAAGDLSAHAMAHSKINSPPEFMLRSMSLMG
jgi:hypothetical protein